MASGNATRGAAERGGTSPRGLLLIDDEAAIRDCLGAILRQRGYVVHAAESGASGLDLFARQAGAIGGAVVDVNLPDVSGRDVARRLRTQAPALPIVLATGDAYDCPGSEYRVVSKPFSVDQLLRALWC